MKLNSSPSPPLLPTTSSTPATDSSKWGKIDKPVFSSLNYNFTNNINH